MMHFSKIKIPPAKSELLDKTDCMYFLTQEIKREIGAQYKPGIIGYENLLKYIGLSGRIKNNIKRTLIEMKQARNILIHRGGYIDCRAIEQCPWTDWQQGKQLMITHRQYDQYFRAACNYIFTIVNRVRKIYGKQSIALPM